MKNKYNAKKTIGADGRTYDSKLEAKRAYELQLMEKAGEISSLQYQVAFDLHVNEIKIGRYISDFIYNIGAITVVEDVKGVRTPLFNWKARHMEAEYGIVVSIYPPKKRKKRK